MHNANVATRTTTFTQRRDFLVSLARAFGGALFFSLPMLMTMEMWEQGVTISPLRLVLFLAITLPVLTGLSWYSGFEPTETLKDDLVDAFVAYAIGFCTSALMLSLLGVIERSMPTQELVTLISLQSIPASIGALLAQSQFGIRTTEEEQKKEDTGYWGELFLMFAGAVYLGLNLAPTEEVLMIGYQLTAWQGIVLLLFSLVLIHAFVYSLQFRGQDVFPEGASFGLVFIRFTVVGYAIALLMSWYILWTFGRSDGLSLNQNLMITIILALPASIGAAAARLIL